MSKHLITIRRLVQTISVLLLVYIIWTTRYPLEGLVSPVLYFRFDPLVIFITSIAERIFIAGLLTASITLVVTFLFGRIFCGWICPLGALMDFWRVFTGLFLKKKNKENQPGKARYIKYVVLGTITIFALVGIQLAWIFDPITIFTRTFSLNIYPFVNNITNKTFALLLRATDYSTPFETLYQYLREYVLSIKNPVFHYTEIMFLMFVLILLIVLIKRRFWCRYICPLGAMLAVVARFSPFKRIVYSCRDKCHLCKNICRMNAIRSDASYFKEECILCLDCIYLCPEHQSTFSFRRSCKNDKDSKLNNEHGKITRAQFLVYLGGSLMFLVGLRRRRRSRRSSTRRLVIRPPASLPEEEFLQQCIRCGNCMKVCITNALQPVLLQSGWSGIWTPHLDPNVGYCEYNCTLCGKVCPTGAIESITPEQKMRIRLGLAHINRKTCIPWSKEQECLVCEEHCPVSEKAIKMIERKTTNGRLVKFPYVEKNLCVGCATCQHKCPAEPYRAITVTPL